MVLVVIVVLLLLVLSLIFCKMLLKMLLEFNDQGILTLSTLLFITKSRLNLYFIAFHYLYGKGRSSFVIFLKGNTNRYNGL